MRYWSLWGPEQCLAVQLMGDGWKCTAISGEMEMSARDAVVNEFREGKTSVLITTDVLSRGFDVQQVSNFHLSGPAESRMKAKIDVSGGMYISRFCLPV